MAMYSNRLQLGMCGKPKFGSDSVFKKPNRTEPNRQKIWHPFRRFSDRNCVQIRKFMLKVTKNTLLAFKCAHKGLNTTETEIST